MAARAAAYLYLNWWTTEKAFRVSRVVLNSPAGIQLFLG